MEHNIFKYMKLISLLYASISLHQLIIFSNINEHNRVKYTPSIYSFRSYILVATQSDGGLGAHLTLETCSRIFLSLKMHLLDPHPLGHCQRINIAIVCTVHAT